MSRRKAVLRKRSMTKGSRFARRIGLKRGSRQRLLSRSRKRRSRHRLRRPPVLPLVSVVMPSYNQAAYIQEAIDSVLGQPYRNLELIVVDGGSTDGTADILALYRAANPARFQFVSEPDNGQAHALNKGLAMARGEVLGWLNSDDRYRGGAVQHAVAALGKHPDWAVVYGEANYIDAGGAVLKPYPTKSYNRELLAEECFICQPAAFMRKAAVVEAGGWKEDLRFCMDYDLWVRLSQRHAFGYVPEQLADSRLHEESKTMLIWQDVGLPEVIRMCLNNYGTVANRWLAEYAHHHWRKGVIPLMKRYAEFGIFGKMPAIASTNAYADGWLPDDAILMVEAADVPVHSVIVNGRHVLADLYGHLHLTAFVEGHPVRSFTEPAISFRLEIPVHRQASAIQLGIHTEEGFSPAQYHLSDDHRELGFIAEDMIALNAQAFAFYRAYEQSPSTIPLWFVNS